ncbi:alpha-lytic protease prodomain-containing protein [Sphaerisporangium rubeum]|uniref:Peptidase S1 domain-containing protein n=1 Tax=Sphaerisporangium rubeum TaxID=321317 RepID=A0A7X0M6H6_9ACTN|nr:hypothetical protein [Sphaerisporangium rubeum]MBB6472009.1 hypothetical protein [Sphaerisporangium rubeum]
MTERTAGRADRARRSLLVLLAAVTAASLTSGTASAGPKPVPAPSTSVDDGTLAAMEAQQPLTEAADLIRWSVERTKAGGYAGIELGDGEVVVWWKGTLPAAVQEAVTEARRGARVRVAPAVHSRAELEKAARRVADYVRTHPRSPYHSVIIAHDGSGLVVKAEQAGLPPAPLPADARPPAEISVSVVPQERPRLAGRLNDTAPFWGGGRINNNDNNSICTAGFPVIRWDSAFMLTAGHCGRPGGSWNNGDDSRFVGTGAYEHVSHDLLLIAAPVHGRIWDGGVGVGEFTKRLLGWGWVSTGERLCASGSVTGARCGFVVNGDTYAMCARDVYGNSECYYDLIAADHDQWASAGTAGDSGGPVFGLWGSDGVIAKGTITATIGRTLVFQDFGTAWLDFNIETFNG